VVDRALGGAVSAAPAVRRVLERYQSIFVVNLVMGLAVLVGFVLFCLPGVALGAVCEAAIPLALFEGRGPFTAIRDSVRRSTPAFWPLAFWSAVTLVLAGAPWLVFGSVALFRAVTHAPPLSADVSRELQAATSAAVSAVGIVSRLFQVVVWSATRPAPPVAVEPAPRPEVAPAATG
jgi:uncharacterized membrane protein